MWEVKLYFTHKKKVVPGSIHINSSSSSSSSSSVHREPE